MSSKQFRTEDCEAPVGEPPSGTVKAALKQERLDARARDEHDGLRERSSYCVLPGAREQAAHHRLDLRAGGRDGIGVGCRRLGPPLGPSPERTNERTAKIVVRAVRALPCEYRAEARVLLRS